MITFPHKPRNFFIQLDRHDGIFWVPPSPIAVPGSAWHLGLGVLGMASISGSNKNNGACVLANGQPVLSQGHAVKRIILPHWNLFAFTPGQPNLLIPFLILGSQSKCQFCSLTVLGPDGPIALSIFKYVGINQACNSPVPLPTCVTVNSGTVEIGFTLADFINGLLNMAIDALISYIIGRITTGLSGLLPRGLLKGQAKALLGRFGLPKIYRAANGRFASMSESLVQKTFGRVFSEVIGAGLGQTSMGSNLQSSIASFSMGAADAIN